MTTATVTPTSKILHDIVESAKGTPLLGSVTWYSIHGSTARYSDLESAFADAGLDAEWLPPKLTDKSAYLKAVRHIETLAKETSKDERGVNYMLRKAVEDPDSTVHVLVREVRLPGERDVEHTTVAKFFWDKGVLSSSQMVLSTARPEIANLLAENHVDALRLHYADRLTEREVRSMALRIIQYHLMGTRLNEKGGVYFVPESHHHHLNGLNTVVHRLYPGSEVSACPVADLHAARRTLYKAMAEEMKRELALTVQEIEESKSNAPKGKDTSMRAKTLSQKLVDLAHLRKKASAYASLMQYTADDLNQRISQVESRVRDLM